MGVDFNAEPTSEGLLLAEQLRRERSERDKALEDRIAEDRVRDLEAAGRMSQARVAAGEQAPAAETEIEVAEREQKIAEAEATEAIERRRPTVATPGDHVPAEPGSVAERDARPSIRDQLEALASSSRPRQTDRQR